MRQPSRILATLAATAALLGPRPAWPQSAYGQLEELCRQTGGNCNPSIPAPSAPTPVGGGRSGGNGVQQGEAIQSTRPSASTSHRSVQPPRQVIKRAPPKKSDEQLLREALMVGLVQGFLTNLLAPPPPPAGPTGPTPEELAEQERQRAAELQARVALVAEQRATRDSQQAGNMGALASAMSAGWDRPVGVADGPGDAVALGGTTPSLFAPPVYRSPSQAAPAGPAVKRLADFAAEGEDGAALMSRFSDLSVQLDAALKEADAIGRMSRNRVDEYQQMERTVAQGVADAWDRGASMAMGGLLLGHKKAVDHVEQVQSNSRAWGELKSILHEAQRGAAFIEGANEELESLDQYRSDAAFALRKREFKADVAYLAERFGGKYAEYGTSILASAKSVREDLQILHRQGELEGFDQRYQAQRERVGQRLTQLIAEVKRTRGEISRRTGLDEKDIKLPAVPAPPGSFGTKAPPSLVE